MRLGDGRPRRTARGGQLRRGGIKPSGLSSFQQGRPALARQAVRAGEQGPFGGVRGDDVALVRGIFAALVLEGGARVRGDSPQTSSSRVR